MKAVICSALLLLAFAVNAQAPTAVPIPKEPHHHLVLENEYVRVFRVSVPAHEATLLHQHDVPYVYVALGAADVINAVQGKPEAHLTMADGQLGYSPGHFAHIARNESAAPFNNVTIELLHPQGEPRNLCQKIIDAPLGACHAEHASSASLDVKRIPVFETDKVRVDLVQIGSRNFSLGSVPKLSRLLVALTGASLEVEVGGQPALSIRPGETIWLPAGVTSRISAATNFSVGSSYLLLDFKDGAASVRP